MRTTPTPAKNQAELYRQIAILENRQARRMEEVRKTVLAMSVVTAAAQREIDNLKAQISIRPVR